jgi:hypothetical protein
MSVGTDQIPDVVAQVDPRQLVHEAYRIEGITPADCRTIFLDWSLGETGPVTPRIAVERLLAHYGADAPEHPMTHVLRAALADAPVPRRRGGYKSRPRD